MTHSETHKAKMARKANRRARWAKEASDPKRVVKALEIGLYARESFMLAEVRRSRFVIPSLRS